MIFAIVLAVFALKCYLVARPGMEDMVAYEKWGKWVGEQGLAPVYFGIYFPIQYQLFGLTWRIAESTGLEFSMACKAVSLLFDVGGLVLVVLLLRRYERSLWYALLYWAHPWFVAVFSLGYVDFQFSFFLLLGLWLATALSEARHPLRYHLLVGVPIAIAFLMKPQTQVIMIALGTYALVRAWRMRTGRYFVTLLPAVLLYVGYSIHFAVNDYPISHLSRTYLDVGKVMPCLTAHMLNMWYPLAYAIKDPAAEIYSVNDGILLTPWHIRPRDVALVITVAMVVFFAGREAFRREKTVDYGRDLGAILAFVTMAVPFTMTSAHENHLFLGAIFLLLYMARNQDRSVMIVWQAIFFLQFLNIYILYETGGLATFLLSHYPEGLRTILAVVDSLLFFYLVYLMLARRRRHAHAVTAEPAFQRPVGRG